ncbi:hypothetical protein HDU84_001601 [Entophlyctis sp. JEL0112]|nr:hypothetical protein HDU84_001601 [Entophlyctis sp. JEL0112]
MFGGPLVVDHEGRTVEVDGFAKFQAFPRVAVLVNGLRASLDRELEKKIKDPSLDLLSGSADVIRYGGDYARRGYMGCTRPSSKAQAQEPLRLFQHSTRGDCAEDIRAPRSRESRTHIASKSEDALSGYAEPIVEEVMNLWATKKHQELSPHAHVDYIHILDTLDESEKIAVLRKRFLGDDVLVSLKNNKAALDQLVLSTPAIPDDPNEALVDRFRPVKCGKWQASYVAAHKDQFRQFLTLSELQAYRWRFTDEWGYGGFYDFEEHEVQETYVRFGKDGKRRNENGNAFRPRVVAYELLENGSVQVGQYPTHSRAHRRVDWGWEFSNGYVMYTFERDAPPLADARTLRGPRCGVPLSGIDPGAPLAVALAPDQGKRPKSEP